MSNPPINPANAAKITRETRVPFDAPTSRLRVPSIAGYHLHWVIDREGRLERAQQAGYEFVDQSEVSVPNRTLGSNTAKDGNTDMGSRVSVLAGGESANGQGVRLYLMKLREEWWQDDQKRRDDRAETIRDTLLGAGFGSEKDAAGDAQHRYVDKARTRVPEFFRRKS